MLDIGGIVALVVLAVLMYVSYWIIRLAVKHGIEDSRRYPPADLRSAEPEQR